MIEVQGLTKRYGPVVALDHVAYKIQPGEIVGLLGPNGAGKTTMLKILTGYMPPTEGNASVAGRDVLANSLEVRRRIGYLPETNPLYEDLAVYEALEWTAKLRGMDAPENAIRNVIDVCGLSSVVGRDIAQLSKGYRQRVGLAQAILHDPEILILDEPTSGLDPNQQSEVRELIHQLKHKKTVLLSTHILSEAQTSCDRVLIIHRGKIVADGTPDSLRESMQRGVELTVTLKRPAENSRERLSQIGGVTHVSESDEGPDVHTYILQASADIREAVFQLCVDAHWTLLQLTPKRISLEDVFRQLTT